MDWIGQVYEANYTELEIKKKKQEHNVFKSEGYISTKHAQSQIKYKKTIVELKVNKTRCKMCIEKLSAYKLKKNNTYCNWLSKFV